MDLSIVVVNFRTPKLALEAMAAAAASASGVSEVQELFVDNGSDDDSVAGLLAGRPHAQVVALPQNRGFAAGVNAGLRAARGRVVLLVNSDAFLDPGAAERLVAHLEAHPGTAVAAPALRNADGSPQLNAYSRFPTALTVFFDFCFIASRPLYGRRGHPYVLPCGAYDAARPVAHAMGAVLAVRAEAARAAGPLDERFFLYLEETEWQRRIAATGARIDLVPDATATHIGGASDAEPSFARPAFLDSLERYHRGAPRVRRAALAGLALTRVVTGPLARVPSPARERARNLDRAAAATIRLLRERHWRRWPPDRDPPLG